MALEPTPSPARSNAPRFWAAAASAAAGLAAVGYLFFSGSADPTAFLIAAAVVGLLAPALVLFAVRPNRAPQADVLPATVDRPAGAFGGSYEAALEALADPILVVRAPTADADGA